MSIRRRRYGFSDILVALLVGFVIYMCVAVAVAIIGYNLNHRQPILNSQGARCAGSDLPCNTQALIHVLRRS